MRWRARVRIAGERRSRPAIRALETEVRASPRVRAILGPTEEARASALDRPYRYWQGTHWALADLAELGHPGRDSEVDPLVDRMLDLWTHARYQRLVELDRPPVPPGLNAIPVIRGRARRCASIQANALLYGVRLGRADDPRLKNLAALLRRWQWPDGGWNCAKGVDAHVSSFMETLLPLRALAAYADAASDRGAAAAARRAGEVFLSRRLFRRRSNGAVMRPEFLQLHFPAYWHYDVLAGLKGMAEAGLVEDPRCAEALNWLEERELPTGGWPADGAYYRRSATFAGSAEYVDWGPVAPRRRNDWVTTDALFVLRAAGRLAA
jgi:hypothetical protein